jgi:hypothetical protein
MHATFQISAGGGLEGFSASATVSSAGPTPFIGGLKYFTAYGRSLPDPDLAALSSRLAGSDNICDDVRLGAI